MSITDTRWVAVFRWIVTGPFRTQTWKNLVYVALSIPLGFAYFVAFTTGTATGIGLLVVWIGLPIIAVTLAGATAVATVEARMARYFIGVSPAVPSFRKGFTVGEGVVLPGNGALAALRRLVVAPTTWTSLLLVFLKFAFGLAALVALVTLGTLVAVMVAAPAIYDDSAATIGVFYLDDGSRVVIDTLPQALLVAAGGIVLFVLGLALVNGLARLQARYTVALLDVETEGPLTDG